jgi:hypothetical protein
MLDTLKKPLILVACLALIGGGAAVAVAANGGSTATVTATGGTSANAAETQYGKAGGCTPGYWKNHPAVWQGYSPSDNFDKVFGVTYFKSLTLIEAAGLGGGGFNALARHAVAALLSASNPNIKYGLSASEIIALVQEAFKTKNPEPFKNVFAALNESGCPIDAHGNPIGD